MNRKIDKDTINTMIQKVELMCYNLEKEVFLKLLNSSPLELGKLSNEYAKVFDCDVGYIYGIYTELVLEKYISGASVIFDVISAKPRDQYAYENMEGYFCEYGYKTHDNEKYQLPRWMSIDQFTKEV